jgi:hypothetical protein
VFTDQSGDVLEATLTYHLLNGTHASACLEDRPQIIAIALTNASYSNVTRGQRVEAFKNSNVVLNSKFNVASSFLMPVRFALPRKLAD